MLAVLISAATAVCKLAEVVGFQHFSCAAWLMLRLNFSWSICGYNDLSLLTPILCQSLPLWKYYNVKLINNKVMKSILTGAPVTFLYALLLFPVIVEDNYSFSL